MKHVEIYEYYSFGYNYHLLLDGRSNSSNKLCYNDLKKYIDFIEELDLRVTLSSINLTNLDSDFEELSNLAKSEETSSLTVDSKFWAGIVEKLKKIDNTLDAELNIKIAYILDEKRYSNEILLEKIHKLFSSNTFLKLPPIAKFDFKESGKCLAFDRYTACAFHSLRGTEDVLKTYYELILGKTASEGATWGTFEKEIMAAVTTNTLTPSPKEELLINIGSLRKFYRNKTQHPQNTYSSDEAQDLFSLCIKTVNELIADLTLRNLI
ncbi:MAG: hypothetical protein U0X41_00675 [Chitinophagales bacterium]